MKVEEWKGGNQNRKRDKDAEYGGMSEPVWPCLYVHSSFFLALFKWLLGHPSAAFSPLTGPHICFSHSSRTLRSLKVQLN